MVDVERAVLKNAMPLDWSRTSVATEVQVAVRDISERIRPLVYKKRSPHRLSELWRHVEIVILNLYVAHFHDPQRWVFYPRSRGFVDGETPLSGELLHKVIDGLQAAGFIEDRKGERGSGLFDPEARRPMRSRMRANEDLYRLLREHGIRLRMISTARDFALIRLKDGDGEPMDLPTDRESRRRIKEMEKNLQRINRMIDDSFVGLHVSDEQLRSINFRLTEDKDKFAVNFTRKRLYRVFNNGSMERGGRFTGGWWAEVPRDARPHIYIGGPKSYYPKFSAEVDFSSMFPSIAYALLGTEMDDSAYQLDGVDPKDKGVRNVVKHALLTMLMAEDANKARSATHMAVSDEHIRRFPDKYPEHKAWRRSGRKVQLNWQECAPKGSPSLPQIIRALEQKHEALRSDFLYKPDKGLYLMYRESQIAERVMLDMADKGAPVLPIHDSFVAMTSWVAYERETDAASGIGGFLDAAMRRAFKDELGVNCRISFDSREHQTNEAKKRAVFEAAPPIDELYNRANPYPDKEQTDYSTYIRHHEDWYGRHPPKGVPDQHTSGHEDSDIDN